MGAHEIGLRKRILWPHTGGRELPPGYRGFLDFCEAIGVQLAPFQRRSPGRCSARSASGRAPAPREREDDQAALLALHRLVTEPRRERVARRCQPRAGQIAFEVMRRAPSILHSPMRSPCGTSRYEPTRRASCGSCPGKGERAHGQTDSFMLGDEVWIGPDATLLEAFETALIKRADARLMLISTSAPRTLDSPLGRLRTRALAGEAERGAHIDARAAGLRWLEWSLPEGEEPTVAARRVQPGAVDHTGALAEQ